MEKKEKLAGMDLLSAVVLIALGIYICRASLAMRVYRTLIISPGLFPLILGGIFVVCGCVLSIMAWKRGGFRDVGRLISLRHITAILRSPNFKRGAVVFTLIILYVGLFGNSVLGRLNTFFNWGDKIIPINTSFMLLTTAYLSATFIYLKAMKWQNAVAVSLCAAVIVFYSFNQGFGIPFP
ncbi:MAG: tripartite tricarboxylate transporter TctB family protein [Planctomycetes bacterium]|nr:tripartite tricarboxylate transporter TctB family protein [Planctomycetota bacterium]